MQPVSFIVPVYNEVDNIEKLHKEILTVARSLGVAFEIIMVDDGSTDETWSTIKNLASQHAHVVGLKLTKNFGKSAALAALPPRPADGTAGTVSGPSPTGSTTISAAVVASRDSPTTATRRSSGSCAIT